MAIAQQQQSILTTGQATTEEALAFFDSLEPVNLDFMWGRWQGDEIATNHPMDGLLKLSNWYGKEFIDPETVHPLLFGDRQGKIFKVAPNAKAMEMVLKMPIPQNNALKPLLMFSNVLFKTEESQARLRMMEYRGKVSATMIYDNLPINDAFRKIDDNQVFGVMDFKKSQQPFFFTLKRVV
jgi:Domain of unknown function (DUF4334)/GXWXG protein